MKTNKKNVMPLVHLHEENQAKKRFQIWKCLRFIYASILGFVIMSLCFYSYQSYNKETFEYIALPAPKPDNFFQCSESFKLAVLTLNVSTNLKQGVSRHKAHEHIYLGFENRTLIEPRKKIPVVLYWTKFFDKSWDSWGRSPFNLNCPVQDCIVTGDRKYLHCADALIFHALDLKLHDLPQIRKPEQLWIWSIWESPSNYGFNPEHEGLFNWTLTYRQDSDVYASYGRVLPLDWNKARLIPMKTFAANEPFIRWFPAPEEIEKKIQQDPLPEINLKGKSSLVAWFVSNCHTASKREKFVNRLKEYIQVDIYGRCGDFQCPRSSSKTCFEKLQERYKFYLSFENSLCKDYATEKVFTILEYNVVPVVFGAANYSQILPPMSYIDALSFKTVQELAKYLLYLSENDKEYLKYFKWKKYYVTVLPNSPYICELCEKLQYPIFNTPARKDLENWWAKSANCRSWEGN